MRCKYRLLITSVVCFVLYFMALPVFWDLQHVMLEDVDRIEVILGPGEIKFVDSTSTDRL